MPLRSIIFIGLAVLMAGLTALLVRGVLSDDPAEQQQTAAPQAVEEKTRVLVAAGNLPIGKIVRDDDVRWQSWPDDQVHDSYLVQGEDNEAAFVGHVVRDSLQAGEPVIRQKIVAPGMQGFLAAALAPGMRAVTVSIDQVSGVAGFVFPGDRVDLILNHQVPDADGERRNVSETVLHDVRVLAIDARIESAAGADGDEAPSAIVGRTATLEVTPKLAEKVTLLRNLGSLTLSLRSLALADGAQAASGSSSGDGIYTQRPPGNGAVTHTWDAEVSSLLPPADPEKARSTVRLNRGGEVEVLEFPKESGK